MIKSTFQVLIAMAFVVQLSGCFFVDHDDRWHHDHDRHYDPPEHHEYHDHDSGIDVHLHG